MALGLGVLALISVPRGAQGRRPNTSSGPAGGKILLIVNATLIDGTGAHAVPGSFVSISLRDGKFLDVSTVARRRGMMALSRNVKVVDGSGKWLIPGFVDADAQVASNKAARTMIRWGVTSARAAGTRATRKMADESRKKLRRPDLFFAGDTRLPSLVTGDNDADPGDTASLTALKSRGAFYVPEMVRREYLSDPLALLHYAVLDRRIAASLSRRLAKKYRLESAATPAPDAKREDIQAFLNAGIPVALGTGIPVLPGAAVHLELADFVKAGMTPMAALVAATRVSAESLGQGAIRGVIAPGKIADFVILANDPLVDIRNTRSIEAVYKNGRRAWSRYREGSAHD